MMSYKLNKFPWIDIFPEGDDFSWVYQCLCGEHEMFDSKSEAEEAGATHSAECNKGKKKYNARWNL